MTSMVQPMAMTRMVQLPTAPVSVEGRSLASPFQQDFGRSLGSRAPPFRLCWEAAAGGLAGAALVAARDVGQRSRRPFCRDGANVAVTSKVVACGAVARGGAQTRPVPTEVRLLCEVLHDCQEVLVLQRADKDTILELVDLMEEVTAASGDTVVHQGDQIASMYVVVEGELKKERTAGDSEDTVVKQMGCGVYFGAVTLLGNTPQRNTVTAKVASRLWRLDREKFDAVVLAKKLAEDDEDEVEDEDELEDEDDGETCGPSSVAEIFVVSDSTGESARTSLQAALRQFDYCFGTTCGSARSTVFRFVRRPEEARRIVEDAADRNALLVYTVMEPKVNETLTSACRDKCVVACDLWGPLLSILETKFGAKRSGVTGRKQAVDEAYMAMVKAIEYTRKVDDGVQPHLWEEADIMLVGPSRAGKTPLAFYLAQRGFKVANYPLVPGEDPPEQLFKITQTKCIALIIQPERLQSIRQERMRKLGRATSRYGSLDAVKKEVRWIKDFYLRRGSNWPIIDTTDAGIVQTAARIIEIFDRRKGDSIAAAYVSELTD